MILVIAFNNYDHKEVRLLDTSLISEEVQTLLSQHLKESKEELWVERYNYNEFYDSLKAGFVNQAFPVKIDNMLFVREYNRDDDLYQW